MHKRSSRRDWQVPRHANIEGTMRHRQGAERQRKREKEREREFSRALETINGTAVNLPTPTLHTTVNPRQVRGDLKTSRINRIARYCTETVSRANFQRPDRSTGRQLTGWNYRWENIGAAVIVERSKIERRRSNGEKRARNRYEERTIRFWHSRCCVEFWDAETRSITDTWTILHRTYRTDFGKSDNVSHIPLVNRRKRNHKICTCMLKCTK